MKPVNVREFFKRYPDDQTCLQHLFDTRYGDGHACPKCERSAKWYPLTNEKAFSCQWCGHHIHPMVGTIFAKSRTPLQMWFYAIFLFTTTRHGVSAKELQRQLGVTYKTAHRMGHLIRKHMAAVDGEAPIGGEGEVVEVDEAYIGGKDKMGRDDKTIVLGMVERGGDAIVKVIPNTTQDTVQDTISEHVVKGTEVHADMHNAYNNLSLRGYAVKRINKRATGRYVGPQGETVNAVENFWRHLKCSITGTHISVSPKYMERYAKEFEYRFNRRMTPQMMFDELTTRFPDLTA